MFSIVVNCEKIADDWGEDGASGNPRTIDTWRIQRSAKEATPEAIRQAIEDALSRYGVSLEEVKVGEEPGEFSACRVEDNDGNADENGAFCVDYYVAVSIEKCEDVAFTFDLGFPKE
jgi:hypothetical protein